MNSLGNLLLSAVMNLDGNFVASIARHIEAMEQMNEKVAATEKAVEKLEEVTNKTSGGGFFKSMASEAGQAGQIFNSHVNSIREKIFNLKNLIGTLVAGAATKSIFEYTLGSAGQYEQWETAFTVMMGSAQGAKDKLKELTDYANTSPFQLNDVVDCF